MAKIPIAAIRLDGGTQQRDRAHPDVIEEYVNAYLDDAQKMPPVGVVQEGETFWLWDGFQRVAAASHAGEKQIQASITVGTHRDAFRMSLGANDTHGLRRTVADKQRAIQSALQDEEFGKLSNREIAKLCNVSHFFVNSLRRAKVVETAREEALATILAEETEVQEKTLLPVENGIASTPEPVGSLPEEEPKRFKRTSVKAMLKAAREEYEGRDAAPQQSGPIGALEVLTRERDEFKDQAKEALQNFEEQSARLAELEAMFASNEPMQALAAENKRLRELNRVLEERIRGLLGEKNEAIRGAEYWQRKAKANGHAKQH
jgi:hypothetical protein